jgi:hypothetical protein
VLLHNRPDIRLHPILDQCDDREVLADIREESIYGLLAVAARVASFDAAAFDSRYCSSHFQAAVRWIHQPFRFLGIGRVQHRRTRSAFEGSYGVEENPKSLLSAGFELPLGLGSGTAPDSNRLAGQTNHIVPDPNDLRRPGQVREKSLELVRCLMERWACTR